jgi:hypothetical protein
MKTKALFTAAFFSLFTIAAYADDPCEAVACLSGKAGIAGGSAMGATCPPAMAAFFSILVFKHGKFKPGSTNQKRREYLESCPGSSENAESIDTIMQKFGQLRSEP